MKRRSLAVVTGANSGIGRAVALRCAADGRDLVLVGRDSKRLFEVSELCNGYGVDTTTCQADISLASSVDLLHEAVGGRTVDLLVSSAGLYLSGGLTQTSEDAFAAILTTNVIGTFRVVRSLIESLRSAQGDVVFVSSTQALAARPGVGAFAATQQAIKAFADALRAEEFEHGVRVLTVYAGRTATPRQELIFQSEGRAWKPETLIDPADLAATILHAVNLPRTIEISELTALPMWKAP